MRPAGRVSVVIRVQRLAGVVAAVDPGGAAIAAGAGLVEAGDGGVEPLGVGRRDRQVRLHDDGQPVRQRLPRRAAVDGLEDAAVRARPHRVLPRPLTLFPHAWRRPSRDSRDRCRRRCRRCSRPWSSTFTNVCAAVGRAIDAALLVRSVGMAQRRDEQPIGILRIDGDVGNLLRVAQTEVRPRPPGVGRLVDAVAGREVGTMQAFAAADVDDVGVGGRNGDRADRPGRLVVEDRLPRRARRRSSSRRRRSPPPCRRCTDGCACPAAALVRLARCGPMFRHRISAKSPGSIPAGCCAGIDPVKTITPSARTISWRPAEPNIIRSDVTRQWPCPPRPGTRRSSTTEWFCRACRA